MSDSREESPDWLRSFQPPTRPAIELSSESEPLDHSPVSDDDDDAINLSKLFNKKVKEVPEIKGKSPEKSKRKNEDDWDNAGRGAKGKEGKRRTSEKNGKPLEEKHSIFTLSSESESSQDTTPARIDNILEKELSSIKERSPRKKLEKEDEKTTSKKKNVKNNISEVLPPISLNNPENDVKEDISTKYPGHQVSSSRLPLLLSEKVQRLKALVECEGDSIDLSGDMGSVGRIVISDDPSKDHEMLLDLKGTIYKTTIVPSRTFCVVSFGQSEAKIEAIMTDFIQLKPQSNVYEAETMVEGTLDGFSFDSEDEADNMPKTNAHDNQDEAAEEKQAGKNKRKAEKTSGAARKKGKSAGGKAPKKVKKKTSVSKKSKAKK